ncbi:hypothetical protein [Bifidobacterium sp. ESL0745]|uniref:phage tail tube protein n=1 Tax=Bifidobacterium sp. ESL0745 TaxID=2983226 RepID=UPI0023FA40F0|nr:hypothetical protein [Bifidobacterium sp. ESL0745]MDF7665732.1 hypothetical protein [Bifidobacterium sp. ESL0745]
MTMPQAHLENGDYRTDFFKDYTAIKDIAHPTVQELANPTLNLSDYLPNDGFSPKHTQEMADDDRESSPAKGQIPGQEKYDGGEMKIIDNTNRDSEGENKAAEVLTKGTKGYIVRRRGKDGTLPYEVGDVVSVYKVAVGIKTPVAKADNARQMSTISLAIDPSSREETSTVVDGGSSSSSSSSSTSSTTQSLTTQAKSKD